MLKFRRSLSEPLKFVWDQDPAFDPQHADWVAKWTEYGQSGDVTVLESLIREGMRPAVFDVKPLSRHAWLTMQGAVTGLDMAVECVAYGLKAIHNIEVDGLKFELGKDDFVNDGKAERLKPEALDRIWDPSLFAALGRFIMEFSRLDPTRGQV